MLFRFGLREIYLLAVSALLIALAISAWGRKPSSAARTTSFAMVSCALWTMGYGMLLAAVDLPGRQSWYVVMVLGMAMVPTSWLLLAQPMPAMNRSSQPGTWRCSSLSPP